MSSPSTAPPARRSSLAPRVAVLIVGFVLAAALEPTWMNEKLGDVNQFVVNRFGWYYVLLTFCFVAFCL